MSQTRSIQLNFVTCASRLEVLGQRLLSSPCLRHGGYPLAVHFNAQSAAAGFNQAMAAAQGTDGASRWLVWVHQDVVLPTGWGQRFEQALDAAVAQFPRLAVAGVYGIAGAGAAARRAGHVMDRGALLRESTPLPCLVDSLDELLFAVRADTGLLLDAALGFDFYATDVVLQAQARGWPCAVVDACCEHWSETPSHGAVTRAVVQRIKASAAVFEYKWRQRLPLTTPCFNIVQPGDVAAFIDTVVTELP